MKIRINPQIELTPILETDKASLIQYLNDESIYQNTLTVPFPYNQENADFFFDLVQSKEELSGLQTEWAIRREGEEMIGGIGLLHQYGKEAHKDVIGYWLATPFRGRGLMTEVVRHFVDFCFDQRGYLRIEAQVFEHNPASARLLEKVGFEKEGMQKKGICKNGEYFNVLLYAKIR